MTQSNSMTDALTKNASLLSGILSQMPGAFGGLALGDDGFSSLLSADNGLDAAGAQQPSLSAAQTSSSQTAFTTNNPIISSDSNNTTSTLFGNLSDLSRNLQKILTALRQAKNAIHSNTDKGGDTENSQSSSHSETAVSSPVVNSSSTPPAPAANVAASDSAKDADQSDAKSVSDIIAELLAMVQMMMAALKQSEASGTDNSTSAVNTTQSSPGSAQGAADLLNLMSELQNLSTNTALGSATDATGATDASSTNPLLQMLQALERDVQQLTPVGAAASIPDVPLSSLASQNAPSAQALTSQFDSLDKALKQVVAGLEQIETQPQTQNNGVIKKLETAAQSDAKNATNNLLSSLPQAGAPDPTIKSVPSDAVQNRLSPLTLSTPAAAQAQVQAQVQQPLSSSEQVTVTGLNAAAIAASARESATGDTNNNFMSGNDSQSAGGDGQNFTTGLSAEGLQASGTYNFASTLSAVRATNGGATGLPSVVDQVILQMNRSVKNGNDQLSLQLHPADLGKITVKLDVGSDGKVQGTVTAENAHTLSMLQKDSRSLERALQDAGLRADPGSLQFNLGSQQNQNQSGQTPANENGDGSDLLADGTQNARDSLDAATIGVTTEAYYVTPTGVNIRV